MTKVIILRGLLFEKVKIEIEREQCWQGSTRAAEKTAKKLPAKSAEERSHRKQPKRKDPVDSQCG